MSERFAIKCRNTKTKVTTTACQEKEKHLKGQWVFKVKTTTDCLRKAQQNAGNQVMIGVRFASGWLRE